MHMKKGAMRGPAVLACLFAIVFMESACSPKARLRASESMFQENRMEHIALFSDGGVVWCSPFSMPVCIIDVAESRAALERFQESVERELRYRGYDVTVSDVARVTHFNLRNLRVGNTAYAVPERYKVFENYRKDRNGKFELPGTQPAYVSPLMRENPTLLNAVGHVMTQIELVADKRAQLETFRPDDGDVKAIREAVNADTVCIGKFYGDLNTQGFMAVAAIVGGASPSPSSKVFFMCFDARTGHVLWQAYRSGRNPPLDVGPAQRMLVGQAFLLFPERNSPITHDCSLRKREGLVWACVPPEFDYVAHRQALAKWEAESSGDIVGPLQKAGEQPEPEDGGRMRGQYIGGGFVHGTVGGLDGNGYHLVVGGRSPGQWSGEVDIGFYYNIPYLWTGFGVKYDFAPIREKRVAPWASLSATLHLSAFNIGLAGVGPSPGIGVDIKLHDKALMRLGYKKHFFSGHEAEQFMLDLLYHFPRL